MNDIEFVHDDFWVAKDEEVEMEGTDMMGRRVRIIWKKF